MNRFKSKTCGIIKEVFFSIDQKAEFELLKISTSHDLRNEALF